MNDLFFIKLVRLTVAIRLVEVLADCLECRLDLVNRVLDKIRNLVGELSLFFLFLLGFLVTLRTSRCCVGVILK